MGFGIQGAKALSALNRLPGRGISDTMALPNGKFVIGGTFSGGTQIFVARLNSVGNMDYSFGRGGVMRVPVGKPVTIRAMLLQGNKYILAGSIQAPGVLEDNEQTFFTPDFDAGAAGLCIQPDGRSS